MNKREYAMNKRMKKSHLKYSILLIFLLITACSRIGFEMAVEGDCLHTFREVPKDSVYTLMACRNEKLKYCHDARIEQWIKPVHSFVLKTDSITISYKDSLNLRFKMQDVWGNALDSITINKPTLVVFVIKEVRGIHYIHSLLNGYSSIDTMLFVNPYVTLIEKVGSKQEMMAFRFDFNKKANDVLYDNRCDEIFLHYKHNGVSPKIRYDRYFKGDHIPRYKSYMDSIDSVREEMKLKQMLRKLKIGK
jgi:hypothetical protein